MINGKKCEYTKCNNIISGRPQARYCSQTCNMYHLREKESTSVEQLPKCFRNACNELVIIGEAGQIRKYCSDECQKQDTYENSKLFKLKNSEPPACMNEDCDNKVEFGAAKWRNYCSSKCRGSVFRGREVSPKCANEKCNEHTTLTDSSDNKYRKWNKYCSDKCKDEDCVTKIEIPPLCRYLYCSEPTNKSVTGKWKAYCTSKCKGNQFSLMQNDTLIIPQPKCMHPLCDEYVTENKNGHWHVYCSQKCAGQHNSSKSREKSRTTCQRKYGVDNPMHSDSIKENKNNKFFEKEGVYFPSQIHLKDILHLLTDENWLTEQHHTLGKPLYIIAEELGIDTGTLSNYFERSNVSIRQSHHHSYISTEWLESIMEEEGIFIQHALNGGEYTILGTRFKADGYCEETNTIYEFHGDSIHGNLNVFDDDELCNPFSDLTAKELYELTKIREEKIKELGYNLIVMWESDYREQRKKK